MYRGASTPGVLARPALGLWCFGPNAAFGDGIGGCKRGKGMKNLVKRLVKKAPYLSRLIAERDQLRSDLLHERQLHLFVPPGHYYSPIPSVEDRERFARQAIRPFDRNLAGIEMNEQGQLALLEKFAVFYRDLPFPAHQTAGSRYFFENDWYSYGDAIFLYCMIRHVRPQRIIEVGSGFSSALMLDTNERFFDGRINCTFIEPNPERLLNLFRERDREQATLIRRRVQDVDVSRFAELSRGDILFIDSTHVSKTGSDVNHLIFNVLPALAEGVHIHFHDVAYPFEYPLSWVQQGRAWNETYAVRAFLQYNSRFKIEAFNTFLEHFHREWFRREMPLCLRNPGGSIWIEKQ
jgi:hypothetical protein